MQEGVQGSESDLGDLISANRLSDVIHRCHQYVGSVESPRSMLYFQALAIARTLQACINMDVMFDPLFANLSVDEPTLAWASPRDEISLRRAFRGMARLVHPDKTSLPPAGEAFQLLQRGAKALASRFRRSRSPQSRPTGRCIHSESDEEPWWEEWDTEKGKQRGRQGDVAEEYRNQLIREQRTREELSREIGSMKREMARSLGRDASRCSVLRQKIAVATDLLTKATAGEDAIGKLRGFFAGGSRTLHAQRI